MIDREKLLERLNDEQREAVLYRGGDSLILAGAGSGKTLVLTTKVAYLLTQGVAPYQILALTFTNKAAREMRERIASLVGSELAQILTMGTFHSVFARWLRTYAEYLGYSSSYTIYDTTDSRALVKIIIKERGLNDKIYKVNMIHGMISQAKNDGLSPSDVSSDLTFTKRLRAKNLLDFPSLYAEYNDRCKRANAMDFDDLLLNFHRLLKHHSDVQEALQERFKYIFVDEYQDTNYIQHEIVRLLKSPGSEITVVGDDAQSIYSFRGAVIDNILYFNKAFAGAKLFKLTKNYRSSSNIVQLANGLIAKNELRIPKEVVAVSGEGEKVLLMGAFTASMEAQMVAAQVFKLIEDGTDPEEIAILYRNNAQSRLLEEHLRMFGINFRIYGGLSFFDRKEVKDVLAYLRLAVNPNDDEAMRRVYNVPTRGIGATTFEGVARIADEQSLPLMSVALQPDLMATAIRPAGIKKVTAFAQLYTDLIEQKEELEAEEFLKYTIHQSGIAKSYSDGSVESEGRLENIQELINTLSDYTARKLEETGESPDIEDFVREMALYTDRDETEDDNTPKVTLMTMHSSKGLEYRHIYCTGLEEGILPSERSTGLAGIEEERRLFYVAITRAKECCTLSFARERTTFGTTHRSGPSRFLMDLDARYIEDASGLLEHEVPLKPHAPTPPTSMPSRANGAPKRRVTKVIRRRSVGVDGLKGKEVENISNQSLAVGKESGLMRGDIVYHDSFGRGEVTDIVDSVSGEKLVIDFEKAGTRQLIAKYARLRKE
ncbi:MAG: UvrD-helicase domain-containing protein [Porphyromonas sp.]|nr:UvrD-helicase domain-containing protein [Porphyromonas sp.]